MFQFNIPNKQYILSLDSLDLCFLRQYVEKTSNERRALWSKCADKESAYYEVELVSEELQDDDSFIEPYNKYMCYICNIDVPLKLYKQHNKSKIHQNCKKLAEKFMENVTKQMNVDFHNIPNHVDHDTFYCETCCKVVARKHKRKHKSSNYHLKSIEHEQLTSKFLEMYINKNVENHMKFKNNCEVMVDSESSSVSDTDWPEASDDNERTNHFTRNNNVLCHPVDTYHSVEKLRSKEATDTSLPFYGRNKFVAFQLDLKEMIKKNKLEYTLHTVEDNSIIIVVPKENKDQIAVDIFPGQKLEQQNVKEHSATGEYNRNTSQHVEVKFAREMICHQQCNSYNSVNKNLSNHADVSVGHGKYQQSTVTTSNTHGFVSNFESTCSDLENESSGDDETISEEELSSSANDATSDYSQNTPLSNENVKELNKKLIEYDKQFSTLNATQLKCLVCSVHVPRHDKNIIEHVEGYIHTDTTAILLKNNYVQKLSLTLYFCYLCNDYTNDFIKHISKDIKHQTESSKGVISKRLLREYVYENPNSQNPIAIHCRTQYNNELKRNKIISGEQSSFYCTVCFINLSRVSEIDHMFGERHRCMMND